MNRQYIIRKLRERYLHRMPLNISAVKRDDPKLVEAVYQVTPFWGWKTALEEAGIDYDKIRVEVLQTVECKICGEHFQQLSAHLMGIHEIQPEDYRETYPNAELVSEQRREQMTGSLRVKPHPEFLPHWEPIYTREYVLDRINTYAQEGFWMDVDTMTQIDVSLIAAARNYLGIDWDDSLRLIGLDPAEYRGLVRDDDYTLADLRQWLDDRERAGRNCTHGVLMLEFDEWHRRPRLFIWGLRQYGNWRAALQAAGVDLGKPIFGGHPFLSKEDVIAELQRLRDTTNDLSHTTVCLLPHGNHLTNAGAHLFGNWEAALDAAKVPQEQRVRQITYETASDVLTAISERIEHHFSLSPVDLYYGSRSDVPLWKKAFELFGSWRKAVKEAGGKAKHTKQAAETPFSTKTRVIAELKRRSQAGQVLAKREITHEEIDKQLYCMAIGYFASWPAAVRAAGFDPKAHHQKNLNPQRKYTEAQEIIDAIQVRHRRSQPLNARGLTHGDHPDAPLLYAARKVFGGWEEAITAAGIDYGRVARKQQDYDAMKNRNYRTYATQEEVIKEIQRRHKAKLPLTHRALTRGNPEVIDNALLVAGQKLFAGDWDQALVAAGLELSDVLPAWVLKRKANKEAKPT